MNSLHSQTLAKLNIKDGQSLAVISSPYTIAVITKSAAIEKADVILVFVTNLAELKERVHTLVAASQRNAIIWLAYPKAKQLNTDLNRDIIHDLMPAYGLDAIRQIAIDETWSAMRFKRVSPS